MKYYTYIHYRKDNLEPFYVGKGQNYQYLAKTGRSKKWEQAVAIHDFIPMKICFWSTEQEAYDHEEFLISCFRGMGYSLCNIAGGGLNGLKGTKQPDHIKIKIGLAHKGRTLSAERKKQLSDYNLQPEIREQIAARFRGPKPKYECKVCGKSASPAMLSRWHKHEQEKA